MSDPVLEAVRRAWSWTGINAVEITAVSPFGHLVIRDGGGIFHYLDPEMRTLECIASDDTALFAYMNDPEIREIWQAEALVRAGTTRLGAPGPGKCFSLTPHALIEGDYAAENICIYSLSELIDFAGNLARELRDAPDGAKMSFKVID